MTIANIPKIFEGGIASAILSGVMLPSEPRIRAWQSIDEDGRWSPDDDRVFPLVDIRASPPRKEPGTSTLSVSIAITCQTKIEDDKSHQVLSGLYAAVQFVLDEMISDDWYTPQKAQLQAFMQYLQNNFGQQDYTISIGGFEFGEPYPPTNDEGANSIGIEFVIHYSRDDF